MSTSSKSLRKRTADEASDDLLSQICSKMSNFNIDSSANNEALIDVFMSVLESCTKQEAEFFLESASWNIVEAVNLCLEQNALSTGGNSSSVGGTMPNRTVERKRIRVTPHASGGRGKYQHRQILLDGLPASWSAFVSAQTGCIYFQNTSGHQQNEVPPGFADSVTFTDAGTGSGGGGAGDRNVLMKAMMGADAQEQEHNHMNKPFVFASPDPNHVTGTGANSNGGGEVLWGDGVALTPTASRGRVVGNGAFRSHSSSHGASASLSPTTRFSVFSPTTVKLDQMTDAGPLTGCNSSSPMTANLTLNKALTGRCDPRSMRLEEQCVLENESDQKEEEELVCTNPPIHSCVAPSSSPNPNHQHSARTVSARSNPSYNSRSSQAMGNSSSAHFQPIDAAYMSTDVVEVDQTTGTGKYTGQSNYLLCDRDRRYGGTSVDSEFPLPLPSTALRNGLGNISNSPLWYEEAEADENLVYTAPLCLSPGLLKDLKSVASAANNACAVDDYDEQSSDDVEDVMTVTE